VHVQAEFLRVVVELEGALVGVMDRFPYGAREVDVGGTERQLFIAVVESHHPLQGVLGALPFRFVAHQMYDVVVVCLQEVAVEDDVARRAMVVDPVACRAADPVRVGWRGQAPLPPSVAEYRMAVRADGRLGELALAAVAVVRFFL